MVNRILGVALVIAAVAVPAGGQSFGRSKVHYEDFDFRILSTPHFDIYYYTVEHDAAVEAGRLAERWYTRFSSLLDHSFTERQPIVLYASHAQFTQTNVLPGILGEGIGGVTENERGRIVLPFAASLGETDHVLGHELVHAFQRDILKKRGRSLSTLPLWFVEGMAEYLSVGRIDPNTAMWLRDAAQRNRLPRIDQLDDPSWFPYRYGQALWAYLATRFGEDIAARSLKSERGGAGSRLVDTTRVDLTALSKGWHAWIQELIATPETEPRAAMTPVVSMKNGAGKLNVGPALSPDGRSLAFFSDRDRYSIDVLLADTATGAIRRTIVQTAGDPHFDSLQFIDSAGAWDATGRRFALAALSRGVPVLTIIDAASGNVERELPVRHADQIFSPAWSPDGRRIAISGLRYGFSDLYVVDVESGDVEALTSDEYADLQPSWSPDGRSLAFSTDRFSSSLDAMSFGEFRLAAIDADSKVIHELPSVPDAKNIDPHWSADGSSVYFIADGGGTSNVYRASIADGQLFRITDVSTGVSGITSLSPALSLAGEANRLAFSVYRDGAYEIQMTEASGGTPVATTVASAGSRPEPAVASQTAQADPLPWYALRRPTLGLPDGADFKTRPYHARLSLNRLIQPYLSAGGGGAGGFVRAGATLSFGDMLGNHQLQTAFQVGRSADDLAVAAEYLNLASRWNWSVGGNQVTWLSGAAQLPVVTADDAFTRHVEVFRQRHRDILGQAIYPFSGARRLEFAGGLQSIAYDRETTANVYSPTTGAVVSQATSVSTAAPTALLAETGAALVYDSSIWGPTSPVLGQRYRFGIAPTFGSLTFATFTADYRRYFMPVRPFTVAVRVMEVGRFGTAAADPRLLPVVWTVRDVVRGYGDTGAGTSSSPPVIANRILIGNVELRFPLAALFGRGILPASLPLEGLVFTDAGRFWIPARSTSEAATLRSVGGGVRVNAAGFLFEFDAVRPFDRPSTGWTFSFNFRPGF